MKNIFLAFVVIFILICCCKNEDNLEPIIEEEPVVDLSFPECLLSDDIFEYQLIMGYPPSEPRGELLKGVYQGDTVYAFNQHILHDYDLVKYDSDCEIVCRYIWNGPGSDCIGNPADHEFIGVVWTDPR